MINLTIILKKNYMVKPFEENTVLLDHIYISLILIYYT